MARTDLEIASTDAAMGNEMDVSLCSKSSRMRRSSSTCWLTVRTSIVRRYDPLNVVGVMDSLPSVNLGEEPAEMQEAQKNWYHASTFRRRVLLS
jgi:hypothetical protein